MKYCLLFISIVSVLRVCAGNTISVNFHVGDDSDGQSDHILVAGEIAGIDGFATDTWNNIDIGNGGTNATGTIFPSTSLSDEAGNTNVATLSTSGSSTWFVGYAASSAATATELGLTGNDDDLFNSYLGLNGPSGDGSPADAAVLTVSGLGAAYTSAGYTLIIYSDSDKGPNSGDRTSTFTVTPSGGSPIAVFTEDDSSASGGSTFDGSYILSDGVDDSSDYSNYVLIEGLTAASFTLELTSPGGGGRGAISGFQIVNGAVLPITPTIHSFTADDYRIVDGESVTLSWDVDDATSLTLDPGNIDVTGTSSLLVSPTVSTTYTLTAESEDNLSVTEELTITIGPPIPNVLIFLVDDFGITDTSVPFIYDSEGVAQTYNFNSFYQTPHMETLASQGVKFTQAYATPVCSSTRTSLMTGYNTTRHGVIAQVPPSGIEPATISPVTTTHDPPNNWKRTGVQADDITMAMILKDAGYRTIHAGKSHFGSNTSYAKFPTAIGFDINLGGNQSGGSSYTSYAGLPNMASYSNAGVFLTDALTQAINIEVSNAVTDGVPFFAYMSHYAVHTPFTSDPNATGDYSDGVSASHIRFATMVEGVDRSLGSIIAQLNSLGVAEETLIIFLGDNGSDSPGTTVNGFASGMFSDFPLRGKKGSSWEGGIRVPLMVTWAKPDASHPMQAAFPIQQNAVEDDLVVVWDILPTVLNITGVTPPHAFDGYDLSPYLLGTAGTHRPQEMLMYLPIDHRNDYFSIYRDENWKLTYFFADDSFKLYDLDADPTESVDGATTAAANPERVMAMARAMAQEFDRTWGIQGELWPSFDSDSSDDPFAMPSLPTVDLDADGLPDNTEDSNNNGLVDETETNPDDSDTDSDNTDDYTEIRLGLDPLNANESFTLRASTSEADTLTLTWPSAPGLSFDILSSSDLKTPVSTWSRFMTNLPADTIKAETALSFPILESRQFFSVEILP